MSATVASAYRESSAQAFKDALRLSGLTAEQARVELAQMTGRSVPITRPTIADWCDGTTAVPAEILAAGCELADMTLTITRGTVTVTRQHPPRVPLTPQLRPAAQGGGSLYMKLLPGGLALAALLLAVLWSSHLGWQETVHVVSQVGRAVSDPQPPSLPANLNPLPGAVFAASHPENSPATVVAPSGRGPRALPAASPQPGPTANPAAPVLPVVAASTPAPTPAPAQARPTPTPVTPTSVTALPAAPTAAPAPPPPAALAGSVTSAVADPLPTPTPAPLVSPSPLP